MYVYPPTRDPTLPVVQVPAPLTSSLPRSELDAECRKLLQQIDELETNVTYHNVKPTPIDRDRINITPPNVDLAPKDSYTMSILSKSPSKYVPPATYLPSKLSTKHRRKRRPKLPPPANKYGMSKYSLPSLNVPMKECETEHCNKMVHVSCYKDVTTSKSTIIMSGNYSAL